MSFSLPAADEKADYVLNQFNRIARRYDLANDVISLGMHRFWKEQAIAALQIKPDGRYLDVCCGTGDLTLKIAQHLSSAGEIMGLDFAANMLDIAQMRLAKSPQPASVQFIQGDALHLPFADNCFDGAIISFGLRNLADFGQGLSEMKRVVKPGDKVVNLDLGRPTNWLFSPLYYFYFCHIVPVIGQILQNDRSAYTYLPKSLDIYPAPIGITQLFLQSGVKEIKYRPLAMGSVALHSGVS